MLTQSIALEFFDFDNESGILRWKFRDRKWFKTEMAFVTWNRKYVGKEVGTNCGKGYLRTQIFGKKVLVHRILWVINYGYTDLHIDHINGIRDDNRIENLRAIKPSENRKNQGLPKNNKSGHIGVHQRKNGRWCASISRNGKKTNLGSFCNKDEAIARRLSVQGEMNYHPNHGKRPTIAFGEMNG